MRTTEGLDRRRQIVQGAFDAMQSRGLPFLSYDAIAEAAGVTRQLVRYHFPDPDILMKEVCDLMAGLYREALSATAGGHAGGERVGVLLDFYFDMLEGTAKPRDDRVYDAMFSLAATRPAIRAELGGQYRQLGQVLSQEFAAQNPDLTPQCADELSWLFVCLMYGHWRMVASLGHDPAHRHVTREAMDRLILSYRVRASDRAGTLDVWSLRTG